MFQPVGGTQALELERHPPVVFRPANSFRAQRIGGTHQIDQVPTAVAALPFACIRIVEIAVQAVAGHFVVETQAVVAGTAGSGSRQFPMQMMNELGLAHPLLLQNCRRDSRDQARGGMGKDVVAGSTVDVQRLADFLERLVGADTGNLQGAVAAGRYACGFEVVPEDAWSHGTVLLDQHSSLTAATWPSR